MNPQKPGLEPRLVATQLLTRVLDDARNLDALCDQQHGLARFQKLETRDQALVRAIVVTALRNRNRIEFILNKLMDRKPPKRARFLIHSLHVAACQILFLDIPDSAAVDLCVTAVGNDERTARFRGMANAVLRRLTREKPELLGETANTSLLSDWLRKAVRSDYGAAKAQRISEALMLESMVDLTVKSDPDGWAERLGGIVLPSGSVRLSDNTPIPELPGYAEGQWWVQDAAASLPAKLINETPKARVLDLCAAPGGKTAQLANAGYDVTALDISKPRLKRLEDNLKRLNLTAHIINSDILEYEPEQRFDAVLLDAPCSSTGTIRRHPDVLWTKDSNDIKNLAKLQFDLIGKARSFLKDGGTLVFSNCSLLKQEGEDVLAQCLKTYHDLECVPISPNEIPGLAESINGQGALRTLPFHFPNEKSPKLGGLDGFFVCRFIKR